MRNEHDSFEQSLLILKTFPSSRTNGEILTSKNEAAIILGRERNGFEISYTEQSAPLSLHCVFKGRETFLIGQQPKIVLSEPYYLVINDGRNYQQQVEGNPEIESLTIHFGVEFATEVLSAQFNDDDVLQFDSLSKNRLPIQFCERLRENDNVVSPKLVRLRALLADVTVSEMLIRDELKCILKRLLHVHRVDVFSAEALPYQRASTKLQMYDRLHRAKDYISSALDENWTLPIMAEAAGFSPYHFQRCFTQMFGETPHQFLTNCRL